MVEYREADQTEKAYQKQDAIFIGQKRVLGVRKAKKSLRYYKNIGLGFKTPTEAIEGNYVDKKCPFTGDVVTIGQCRPLSKTVRFNVLEHQPAKNRSISVKKLFRVF
eukprot:gene21300-27597_t